MLTITQAKAASPTPPIDCAEPSLRGSSLNTTRQCAGFDLLAMAKNALKTLLRNGRLEEPKTSQSELLRDFLNRINSKELPDSVWKVSAQKASCIIVNFLAHQEVHQIPEMSSDDTEFVEELLNFAAGWIQDSPEEKEQRQIICHLIDVMSSRLAFRPHLKKRFFELFPPNVESTSTSSENSHSSSPDIFDQLQTESDPIKHQRLKQTFVECL